MSKHSAYVLGLIIGWLFFIGLGFLFITGFHWYANWTEWAAWYAVSSAIAAAAGRAYSD